MIHLRALQVHAISRALFLRLAEMIYYRSMQNPFIATLLVATVLFAGEPTLVTGHAVSFHLRKWENWGSTDSATMLVKDVSGNFDDRYDIFNMNSESADIQVAQVWPAHAGFKLHLVFVWPFTCDLYNIQKRGLARQNLVAGPCGAGWQIDTVSSTAQISALQVWTPLRTNALADSIDEYVGRMSTGSAWIDLTLEGADSVEVLVSNWKTDKVILASPTSSDLPDWLSLRNECGSALKVVATEIPLAVHRRLPNSHADIQPLGIWNPEAAAIQHPWKQTFVDTRGRLLSP